MYLTNYICQYLFIHLSGKRQWELPVLLKNTIQCSQSGLEARLLKIEEKYNKQLFPNEIVSRFRKDIGSSRKPGVVIYSPWEVSGWGGGGDLWSHLSVITGNTYFPFTLPQGRGYVLQAHKCSRAANDPSTANDPKTGNDSWNSVAKNREWRGLYE